MIARFKDPIQDVGPHTALVLVAIPELYPILARFGAESIGPTEAWRSVTEVISANAMLLKLTEFSVSCDAMTNPPDLALKEHRVCVQVGVQLSSGEYFVGRFTMGRVGRDIIEIEYESLGN